MKKTLITLFLPTLLILGACSSDNERAIEENSSNDAIESSITTTSEVKNPEGDGKALVAYFSLPVGDDLDVTTGASVMEANGEYLGLTQQTANWISEELKADTFRIQADKSYPTDIDDLLDVAAEEKSNNDRPSLASKITNLDQYDTVYLGYPIWNADFPMAFYTFLESYDFSGKRIVPFSTHGGSGLAGTVGILEDELSNSEVVSNALSISRNNVADSRQEVIDWVDEVK
ncbi:flavodoxin [Enterococcus thailandicus]|uniref:flavodoxin n=1 Tax=Enterococcus thailandicus TaxID=417368 RepID=UPI0022EC0DFD|nr:flavodoxin [Enterococcus thailandicus]MDA3972757.1 flavodoxin [Enterococcus thailandicus]MDA3975253.1 flavodoxin [Enterococcus thailandicus]MDA3980217.1 flavodoxin [Enterococcus thailandicus]